MNFYLDFIVLYYIRIPIINHFTSCLSDGQRHCYQTLRLAKIILSFQEANISENMIHRTQVTMQTIFHFVIHTHSTSFCKTNKLIIKKKHIVSTVRMLYNTTQETTEMEAEHIFHLATIRQIQSINFKQT